MQLALHVRCTATQSYIVDHLPIIIIPIPTHCPLRGLSVLVAWLVREKGEEGYRECSVEEGDHGEHPPGQGEELEGRTISATLKQTPTVNSL